MGKNVVLDPTSKEKYGVHATSMNERPLVSVIMPAYNAQQYIATAIHSLLEQSYSSWELLVVNDGSVDETESEILKFDDPRIRYYKQDNKGVSAARNVALKNMRGKFFCFLDADDAYPKDSIMERLAVFEESEEIEFVGGTLVFKDEFLNETIDLRKPSFSGNPHRALARLDSTCFGGPGWMLRRKDEKEYRFKEGLSHCEDWLFYIGISGTGIYQSTPAEVLFYRVSGNSAMSNLKGLEDGYAELYRVVKELPSIHKSDKAYLWRRIIRIMTLSYVSRQQIVDAVRVLFRYILLR